MYCSKCGQQLPENTLICDYCGFQAGTLSCIRHDTGRMSSTLPWIIALVSVVVSLATVVGVLLAGIGGANGSAVLALDVDEQRFELIEQRLMSIEYLLDTVEHGFYSIEAGFESIVQRLSLLEMWLTQVIWPSYFPQVHHPRSMPKIPLNGWLYHYVQQGETLSSIVQIYWPHDPATYYGEIVRDELVSFIAYMNDLSVTDMLYAGMVLRIYPHPHVALVFY